MNRPRQFSNAEKQRRYRRRKRDGIRIISLELGKADIDALIDRGGLSEADLDDLALAGQAFRAMTSHSAAMDQPGE